MMCVFDEQLPMRRYWSWRMAIWSIRMLRGV